ncbi:exosortase H-associated membrane protein [Haliea sp. E17]|uniref:exosortase H-associated membrane protein n=1 Tax=Haliea sp. E17 TaxID=3401576 RepID=UPI003AB0A987
MQPDRALRQFLLFAFVLILPCFALWTVAAQPLAMPVVGLVDLILKTWFPTIVEQLQFHGADTVLLTRFGELNGTPVPPSQSEYQLGFTINPGILSYSFAFYAALHFATQKKEYLWSFLTGVMVLYPLFLLGVVSLCLKQLMVNLGPLFLDQPGVLVPNSNLIALFYQLNVLIIPTIAPIALWIWQNWDTPLLRGVFRRDEETPAETAGHSLLSGAPAERD